MVISFERHAGRDHARYAMIGPVSYDMKDANTTCLGFETINKECPLNYLMDALLNLKETIETAILFVERNYDVKRRLLNEKK